MSDILPGADAGSGPAVQACIQIVGAGRMGTALDAALRDAGCRLLPLAGRGATGVAADGTVADAVLLAVPDAQIPNAASLVVPGPFLGHLSGATTLEPLLALDGREAFSLHPLLTVTGEGAPFAGAYAALAGSTPAALAQAEALAAALGMRAFLVQDPDRAAYHAAASIASNFLLTLEHLAETLAGTAGVPREALEPIVRATVDNWAAQGAAAALTGPIARGDEATLERQRAAVAERLPERLALFDELVAATRALAGRIER